MDDLETKLEAKVELHAVTESLTWRNGERFTGNLMLVDKKSFDDLKNVVLELVDNLIKAHDITNTGDPDGWAVCIKKDDFISQCLENLAARLEK